MIIKNVLEHLLEWEFGYLDVFLVPMSVKTKYLKTRLSEYKQVIRLRASRIIRGLAKAKG